MIPRTKGFFRSVAKHNVDLDVLADWIEGCALFGDGAALAGTELVDILLQENIYAKQDFCWERVDDGLRELRRRSELGSAFSLRVSGRKIERLVHWRDAPVHSFLLLFTLAQRYDHWAEVMPVDYNVQGDLFEEVTKESLGCQFPDWIIHPTGWSKTHPTKLGELVADMTERLGEIQGVVEAWTDAQAKEAGLDLLCYRPFLDEHVGVPLLMLQCASGNWKEPGKLKTPDLDVWTKIVVFASRPKKAFATPFSFLRQDFRRVVAKVDGVVLDRYRLLIPNKYERDWVSETLQNKLRAWLDQRVGKIAELTG
ncbi:MAG: hypothetical protein ACLQBK_11985 [Candidatus Sulfotelmatobacter sp.]